jgi:Fe2+ transport system protein FeoA
MTLDQLPLQKEAMIIKTGGEGPLRLRLLDMGLIRGTRVTVMKMAPMGDPMEIRLRGYSLTLRREDARNIQIQIA